MKHTKEGRVLHQERESDSTRVFVLTASTASVRVRGEVVGCYRLIDHAWVPPALKPPSMQVAFWRDMTTDGSNGTAEFIIAIRSHEVYM